MNMFSTGNPEEDELLRLLRQGLITPEQLEDMSAGQQAAQDLRSFTTLPASETYTPRIDVSQKITPVKMGKRFTPSGPSTLPNIDRFGNVQIIDTADFYHNPALLDEAPVDDQIKRIPPVTETNTTIATQAPAPTRESEQVQTSASVTPTDTVLNVRNNNPGNIKIGDVETGQRWYGKDAVKGVDKRGFGRFATADDGINALFQQIRIDSNRINEETGQPQTVEEFIDRYTPVKDDPEGNEAAKINIPKFVGASLSTALADINPIELALAITRQEGGNEALQAFEPGIRRSALTLADIERGAANAEKIAREREVETRFGQGSTPDPQDRTVSRDSPMLGMPTQGTTAQQDDELTKRLVGENYESQGPPTFMQLGRDVDIIGGESSRSAIEEQGPQAEGTAVEKAEEEIAKEEQAERVANYESQGPPTFMQLGRDVDIIGMDEAARTADKPRGLPTLERDITDPDMSDDTVTADAEEVELDLEGMALSPTLLQRIGNALKDNPEAFASGAQLLGGLISNAAQNRAQRRADRTTDQRVARANLISAITGGRARPTVERAQADTGGFMSLDTLGKALQGGGAAVKGELARRVEEAERERKAGLEKRALDIKDFEAQSLDDFRKGKIEAETGSADLSAVERRQIKELKGSIDVVDQFIKDFDNIEGEDGFMRALGGLSTNVPILGAQFFPKAQKFTDQRSILVGQVAKIINGGASGQISDFEQKLANEAVPDIRKMRDSREYGRSKLTALKDLFELRRQAMLRGIDKPLHTMNAFYEITAAERKEGDEGAAEVTPESITGDQRSLLQRARDGDEEAVRQARELGLI